MAKPIRQRDFPSRVEQGWAEYDAMKARAEAATEAERQRCLDVARAVQRQSGPTSARCTAIQSVIEAIESGGVACDGCEGTGRVDRGESDAEGECGQCSGSGWHI